MANTTRRMAAMAVMTLGVAATAAANDVRATIVLNIANQCEIRQPVLAAAQETATSLYDVIGVRLVWLPARIAPAPELADALRFRVVLVAEVAQGRLLSVLPLPAAERATVLGMARVDARSAYLFCYRIARLAKPEQDQCDRDRPWPRACARDRAPRVAAHGPFRYRHHARESGPADNRNTTLHGNPGSVDPDASAGVAMRPACRASPALKHQRTW